ncbi:MAG: hypothetical protein H0S82_06155 [Anaerolineaceae bacterium]|nr:hypothetical protein [Anaerolineaceae bacterium]
MNHWKQYLKALFLIILLFGFARPALAQTGTIVSVDPAYLEVDPGEMFSVDVMVTDVVDLFAFDVMVSYDPGIITFDHFDYGDFIDEGISFTVPHDPGCVQFVRSQTSSSDPKTGSGTLVTLYFVANQVDGESDIILDLAELSDIDGVLIPVDSEDGFVQVGQPKEETETFLPLIVYNTGK